MIEFIEMYNIIRFNVNLFYIYTFVSYKFLFCLQLFMQIFVYFIKSILLLKLFSTYELCSGASVDEPSNTR